MQRAWHNLAQPRAGLEGRARRGCRAGLCCAVLLVAGMALAGCAGGPHPEPPNDQLKGSGGAADAGVHVGGAGGSSENQGSGGRSSADAGTSVPVTSGTGGMGGAAGGGGGRGCADAGVARDAGGEDDAGAARCGDDAGALR